MPPSQHDMNVWTKLFFCVLIDLVGLFTYLIPGAAESIDVVWAPISAFLLLQLFGRMDVAAFGMVEELLPFTDFIPVGHCLFSFYCRIFFNVRSLFL